MFIADKTVRKQRHLYGTVQFNYSIDKCFSGDEFFFKKTAFLDQYCHSKRTSAGANEETIAL